MWPVSPRGGWGVKGMCEFWFGQNKFRLYNSMSMYKCNNNNNSGSSKPN